MSLIQMVGFPEKYPRKSKGRRCLLGRETEIGFISHLRKMRKSTKCPRRGEKRLSLPKANGSPMGKNLWTESGCILRREVRIPKFALFPVAGVNTDLWQECRT